MTVRAKFKCDSITDYGNQKQVKLSAVTTGKGSEDFTPYTPAGDLSIYIKDNTPAYDFFKPGKQYFLLFDEVETDSLK